MANNYYAPYGENEDYPANTGGENPVYEGKFEDYPDRKFDYTQYEAKLLKKKNKKLRPGFVAAIMAVMVLAAGASGAGTTYYLLNNQNSSNEAVQSSPGSASYIATALVDSSAESANIINAVNRAASSVVEISTETTQYNNFFGQYVTEGAGSGVILTGDGYIATNNHVIESAGNITVRLNNGTEYSASLIGTDSATDLAVIKINATGLTTATFADSGSIQVGQTALAIGNPLGELGGTVTDGIISAKERNITIDGQAMNLLQTSAAVNPGNSGGGLFDINGNLIGIVNAKSSGSGIEGLAFAIPSNTVQEVSSELIQNGYVSGRPQLGISVQEITDARTAYMYGLSEAGVYISSVTENNGLASGDRIISVAGTEISSRSQLSQIISSHKVGDTVSVIVKRNGANLTVNVKLTEQIPASLKTKLLPAA